MRKIVAAVGIVLALAVAAIFLFRSSDEDKIQKMLRECADAAEKGDAGGILRHLDPACTLNGAKFELLEQRLRQELGQVRGARVEIGVSPQVSNDEASVGLHVRVRAAQHVLGEADLKLHLKRVGDEWKILRVDEVR